MVQNNKTKTKIRKNVSVGVISIMASFNNTIVVISDLSGDVIAWASGGSAGFKGSRKSTPFAAQCAMDKALEQAIKLGLKTVSIKVKGPGSGRESAIRTIGNYSNITVTSIRDVTPIPHNGTKPPKRRSV